MKSTTLAFVTMLQSVFLSTLSAATFYVSPSGDNTNKGTSEDMPFLEVQYAIDQMTAGDTLVVLDGYYPGSIKLKSGITIQAKNPRKAVFSGAEVMNNTFELHSNGIYRTPFDKKPKLIFFNYSPMTWACWPNIQWSENWDKNKKWALATDGTGPGVLTSAAFSSIKDLDLTGGYCFLRYGKGNSCYSRLIESFDGTVMHWNDDNFYTQQYTGEDGPRGSAEALLTLSEDHAWHPNKSKFFLAGDFDLLDAPGEWIVEGNTLYIYPPGGRDPNGEVILAQTNDYCINEVEKVTDITIEGVDFFACSVNLENSENAGICFNNVYFTYIGGELLYIDRVQGTSNEKPIKVTGSHIRFEKCLFAGAQNSALQLEGSDITVQNCVFIENNRHANFESRGLQLRATGTYKIIRNTFFNNCSDHIRITYNSNYEQSANPEISCNNLFNGGIYNSDVSGIYLPTGSQKYLEVHHNWMHNINGNALRLDLAGTELTAHHNVFWASQRGLNIEGYGKFNIYNNTSVHNQSACFLTRNVLNHANMTEASFDSTFPPIDDWNVLNNLVENFVDRVGPREKDLLNSQREKGLLHPERMQSNDIPITDRGAIQGNLTGFQYDIFTNGSLSGLNLIPRDNVVRNGVSQTDELASQGVTSLGTYRGAYDVGDDYWFPGSDWMPYGLKLPRTMVESEQFAKDYYAVSIVPEISTVILPEIATCIAPAPGSVNISIESELTFNHGYKAKSANVYFGTDSMAVANASVDSPEFLVNLIYPENDVDLNDLNIELKKETEYFWRVDAINENGEVTAGNIWHFTTEIEKYDVQLKILDAGSKESVGRVIICFNERSAMSNSKGIAKFPDVLPGSIKVTLIHGNYFEYADSVTVTSDTTLIFKMVNLLASVKFLVTDGINPLGYAKVVFNDYMYLTGNNGMMFFSGQPARKEYIYQIYKEGYQTVSDTFFLEIDTVLSVQLQQISNTMLKFAESIPVRIYPNPASDKLFIELPLDLIYDKIRIIDMLGRTCLSQNYTSCLLEIDVSVLPGGLYSIQITGREFHIAKDFMKITFS